MAPDPEKFHKLCGTGLGLSGIGCSASKELQGGTSRFVGSQQGERQRRMVEGVRSLLAQGTKSLHSVNYCSSTETNGDMKVLHELNLPKDSSFLNRTTINLKQFDV